MWQYPNHPWQSWRHRWIKKLRTLPRPVTGKTPDREIGQEQAQSSATPFTSEDKQMLLDGAEDILNVDPSKENEAWSRFAEDYVGLLLSHHCGTCLNRECSLGIPPVSGKTISIPLSAPSTNKGNESREPRRFSPITIDNRLNPPSRAPRAGRIQL